MTVGVTFKDMNIVEVWKTMLSNVLTKKYYFNLVSVNILLCTYQQSLGGVQTLVDWMFGVLKENKNVLKYQFKQLRIGIQTKGFRGIHR